MTSNNLTTTEKFRTALWVGKKAYQNLTGVDKVGATLQATYDIATYFVPKYVKFPLMTLFGGTGTGKTTALKIHDRFMFNSFGNIRVDNTTFAALSAFFYEANDQPLVLDQADHPRGNSRRNEIEDLLMNRYDRESAKAMKMTPASKGGWEPEKPVTTFGPTVVHRQEPYASEALNRRNITIETRYFSGEIIPVEQVNFEFLIGQNFDPLKQLTLPDGDPPNDMKGGAFDTFRPLWDVACAADDQETKDAIIRRISIMMEETQDAQQFEIRGAVLMALVQVIYKDGNKYSPKRIRLHEISEQFKKVYGKNIHGSQVSRILKNLGIPKDSTSTGGYPTVSPSYQQLEDAARKAGLPEGSVPARG